MTILRGRRERRLSSSTVAAIETHELAREFEGGIKAVDGVDLEVAEGEIYGFLGPNGAGQDDDGADADHAAAPDRRHGRSSPGYDVAAGARRGARARSASRCRRRRSTR